MPPIAEDDVNKSNAFLSFAQAWLDTLINTHLDGASRVALFQTSRTLCELVLSCSTVPKPRLRIDVSGGGVILIGWHKNKGTVPLLSVVSRSQVHLVQCTCGMWDASLIVTTLTSMSSSHSITAVYRSTAALHGPSHAVDCPALWHDRGAAL
jgi:hypothetical protein